MIEKREHIKTAKETVVFESSVIILSSREKNIHKLKDFKKLSQVRKELTEEMARADYERKILAQLEKSFAQDSVELTEQPMPAFSRIKALANSIYKKVVTEMQREPVVKSGLQDAVIELEEKITAKKFGYLSG